MVAFGQVKKLRGWKVWLTATAGIITAMLLLTGIKPVYGTAESAKSAQSFVDSVGVNTHLNYFDTAYGDYTLLKDKLSSLGVQHIRDGTTYQVWNSQTVFDRYKDLNSSLGIKIDSMIDPRSANLSSIDSNKIDQIYQLASPSIESFEGPNEFDLSGSGNWASTLSAYQKSLYSAVKNNPATKDVPVLGPSLTSSSAYSSVGDLSSYLDYGNIHNYYAARNPGAGIWRKNGYGSISWNLNNSRVYAGQKPTISTETGYHNLVPSTNGHPGTPEAVAGKYMPRVYLEQFLRGIPRTYAYEFIDEKPDPNNNDPEQHFGLLRNDGTEKPAYTTLKNLLSLLKDNSSGSSSASSSSSTTAGTLDYSLSGQTTDVHKLLLQKTDGKFYLVLWQEVPSYDPSTEQEIQVPDKQVTLTFNQPVDLAVTYLPYTSAAPVGQYDAPGQLDLGVPDHPLVVEVTPGPASTSTTQPS